MMMFYFYRSLYTRGVSLFPIHYEFIINQKPIYSISVFPPRLVLIILSSHMLFDLPGIFVLSFFFLLKNFIYYRLIIGFDVDWSSLPHFFFFLFGDRVMLFSP